MEELKKLIKDWKDSGTKTKESFIVFKDFLESKTDVELELNSRPGISYSLRGKKKGQSRPLFVLLDIIDDDPMDRWLSVCFYGDTINDPNEEGDFVPGGLLGEDGHCFDLDEGTDENIQYIRKRIEEAYEQAK
ncbi:MAG: hypothetical protein RBR53_04160 [Desulforegulaceae bacterium]|nr:hypothetical protein [Desulforegulaceae bacterium]